MTTYTDSRKETRDLIRSFALVDEYLDRLSHSDGEKFCANLARLNQQMSFLLSFPVTKDQSFNGGLLASSALAALEASIPFAEQSATYEARQLRQTLRDNLYELLVRMDECTDEQLKERGVHVPPLTNLSLMQLNQLVRHMMARCLEVPVEGGHHHHNQ